jgi:hypothetical protein
MEIGDNLGDVHVPSGSEEKELPLFLKQAHKIALDSNRLN